MRSHHMGEIKKTMHLPLSVRGGKATEGQKLEASL